MGVPKMTRSQAVYVDSYMRILRERLVEWLNSLFMLMIGFVIILRKNLGDHFILISDETAIAWGLWLIFISISRIIALIINGHWSRTPIIRSFFSALGLGTWVYVFVLLVEKDLYLLIDFPYILMFLIGELASAFFAGSDSVHAERAKEKDDG